MMAKYEENPNGKYQCPVCDYGRNKGKTRQSVSKHFNKLHKVAVNENTSKSDVDSSPEEVGATIPFLDDEVPITGDMGDSPEWLNIDFEEVEEVDIPVQSIPPIAKGFLKTFSKQSGAPPKGGKELEAFQKQQAKVVKWILAGVADPMVSWWARGLMNKPEYAIERSQEEWDMVENITRQWLEYRNISIPINPDVVMIGCMTSLYVPPISYAYRNRSGNRNGIFSKWKKRRALKKALKEELRQANEA